MNAAADAVIGATAAVVGTVLPVTGLFVREDPFSALDYHCWHQFCLSTQVVARFVDRFQSSLTRIIINGTGSAPVTSW